MNKVEVLDLDNTSNIQKGQKGVWEESIPMVKCRSAFGMCTLGEYIYACGGWNEEGHHSRSMERWKPGMRKWEKCGSMKLERSHFGFAVIGGRIVAAGGQDDLCIMTNTVEVCGCILERNRDHVEHC